MTNTIQELQDIEWPGTVIVYHGRAKDHLRPAQELPITDAHYDPLGVGFFAGTDASGSLKCIPIDNIARITDGDDNSLWSRRQS